MVRTLSLAALTLIMSFFVGLTVVHAQETTETPTPTPTEAMEDTDDTPSAPPQTGFGF